MDRLSYFVNVESGPVQPADLAAHFAVTANRNGKASYAFSHQGTKNVAKPTKDPPMEHSPSSSVLYFGLQRIFVF
jgi:hypothetical protein